MDYSPLGSSVHGILQARILEKVAIFFSRVSTWSRDWTQVSCIAGRFSTIRATRKAQYSNGTKNNPRKLNFDFNFRKTVKTDKWFIWRFRHPSFHSPSDGVSFITTCLAAVVYPERCHLGPVVTMAVTTLMASLVDTRKSPLTAPSWFGNRKAVVCFPPWTVTRFPYPEAQFHSGYFPSTGPGFGLRAYT